MSKKQYCFRKNRITRKTLSYYAKTNSSKNFSIETDIKEIKNHMRYAMTALVGGMFAIIVILFEKL